MADEKETRAGAFSGVVAGIMVIALTAMGFVAFQPSSPLETAQLEFPIRADLPLGG